VAGLLMHALVCSVCGGGGGGGGGGVIAHPRALWRRPSVPGNYLIVFSHQLKDVNVQITGTPEA